MINIIVCYAKGNPSFRNIIIIGIVIYNVIPISGTYKYPSEPNMKQEGQSRTNE
jgi:hypothetical protein